MWGLIVNTVKTILRGALFIIKPILSIFAIVLVALILVAVIAAVIVVGSLVTVEWIKNSSPNYAGVGNDVSLLGYCLAMWAVAITAVLTIGGWLWNSRENRKSVQKNIRLKYLVDAFLKFFGDWKRNRRIPENRKFIEAAEEAVPIIQLYGTKQEIEAFAAFHKATVGSEEFNLEAEEDAWVRLLNLLRNNLRKELGLKKLKGEHLEVMWYLDNSSIYNDPERWGAEIEDSYKAKRKSKKQPKPKKPS